MENSATSNVIAALPLILRDKPRTISDIWQYLIINDDLKQQLITKDGRRRIGILQGITTRIKAGKLSNFKLIKGNDGHTMIMYVGNDAYQRAKSAHQLLEELHVLNVGELIKDEKRWQEWDKIETKVVDLNQDVLKFMENVRYAQPTETFYPKAKKGSYPITKFKYK
ncbi:hypothetical protein [Lactiplantibacillus plantarum]|uniref:hypothetical protein n=1 Tax=Lactiplantibacillus plantarum TaxID=1590 RepID=UPI001BAE28C6|nr:hypothetical protein [Lactiplantibacillus plantarum]MBS0955638.1 hypothetical protein [Lactiplantibacillus plantarum]